MSLIIKSFTINNSAESIFNLVYLEKELKLKYPSNPLLDVEILKFHNKSLQYILSRLSVIIKKNHYDKNINDIIVNLMNKLLSIHSIGENV